MIRYLYVKVIIEWHIIVTENTDQLIYIKAYPQNEPDYFGKLWGTQRSL